ncbi:hypothetical protein BJX70DRAFT_363081 [Aspergillus crustosus]
MAPMQPQVRDPADKAIDMMVRELGFNEEDAKWALKITDTGEGINPNAAVALLMQEYQRQTQYQSQAAPGYSSPPPYGSSNSNSGQTQRNNILSSVMQRSESLGLGLGVDMSNGWRWA